MSAQRLTYRERMRCFHEARFGLFIHWGLYSLLGRGVWAMHNDRIPVAEYAKLADQFKPKKFDANAWAELAVEAGMKYAVLTTRQHDGFCLFDSEVSDFTSIKAAANRDFVAEYVAACRAAGLKIGFYYSLLDWRFPGYFESEKYRESSEAMIQQAHDQVRELLTNYGKIDMIFFDGWWSQNFLAPREEMAVFWRSRQLLAMVRRLQRHVVVNDRTGLPGDYTTPEQEMPIFASPVGRGRAWEVCQTIGDYSQSWCYQRYTARPIRKSAGQLILQLATLARWEGNMLLNVGPKPDGTIPKEDADRLRAIGKWLRVNGEAIYGSQCSPIPGNSVGQWTFKGATGYLHLPCWPGEELILTRVEGRPKSAKLLATGKRVALQYDRERGRITLSGLPRRPPELDLPVIKVEFDGRPKLKEDSDKAAWLNA